MVTAMESKGEHLHIKVAVGSFF